jgi:TPR repeat protein
VSTDREVAQRWFRAAAERGHPYAQMMLGRYLARGLAGERDFVQARHWLEKAVGQGLAEARSDLSTLPELSANEGSEGGSAHPAPVRAASH